MILSHTHRKPNHSAAFQQPIQTRGDGGPGYPQLPGETGDRFSGIHP